jgi:hypothetical protein
MYFYGITGLTLDPYTHIYCRRDKKRVPACPAPPPQKKRATFRSSSARCTHQHTSSSYCPSLPTPPPCPPTLAPWPVLGPWSPRSPSSNLPAHLLPFSPVTHQYTYINNATSLILQLTPSFPKEHQAANALWKFRRRDSV